MVHGGQKIKSAQKFMQVEVDVKCMQTNFDGCGFFGFRDFAPFHLPSTEFSQNFPLDHGLYIVHGGQKNQLKIKIGLVQ